MRKRTYLVLGSCFMLQATQVIPSRSKAALKENDIQNAQRAIASAPVYHREQTRELLGASSAAIVRASLDQGKNENGLSMALYIHDRTRELLPEPWRAQAPRVAQALIETASRYKMDPVLLMALIRHESRFNPGALGSHGEIGLMQIKPSTALWLIEQGDVINHDVETLSEALKDPVTNIAFGAAYLARLKTSFKGRGTLYLSAYNMGAVNLKTHLRNGERPRIYSDRILSEYVSLALDFASQGGSGHKSALMSYHAPTLAL